MLTAVAALVPLVVAVIPVKAAAATTRIRCHDGVFGATVIAKGKTQQGDQSCDLDQTRDGKCTFDVVLVRPPPPDCPFCRLRGKTVRVRVKVRGRRVVKNRFAKFLLRCLPSRRGSPLGP